MKTIKYLFLLLMTTSAMLLHAQDLTQSQKWIKAGNSLREAQQYEQAETYLMKGLNAVQRLKNTYWEAVADEYLGLLNADLEDIASATAYFNKALRLYQGQQMSLSVKALKTVMSNYNIPTDQTGQLYGGIDVGSRGVKYSIIKVNRKNGHLSFQSIKDGSVNTNVIDFTPTAIDETSAAVKRFVDTLLQNNIPMSGIYIAVSSGVKQEADKATGREAALRDALAKAIPAYPKAIEFLSACREGDLSIQGVMPAQHLFNGSLVDIGSGNTKGGYYVKEQGTSECYSLPWGTSTVSKKIDNTDISTYQQAFATSISSDVSASISRKPGLTNRKYTYFTGGIVWAMCNYMHPDKMASDFTDFTRSDVDKFVNDAIHNYEALIAPDLSSIASDDQRRQAQSTLEKTRNTFTQKNIVSGALLLQAIVSELDKNGVSNKQYTFARYGSVGWISGYMTDDIRKSFSKVSE